MRLVTFSEGPGRAPRIGAVVGGEVADLGHVAADMLSLLSGGREAMAAAGDALAPARRLDAAAVTLHAPMPRPPKFLAIGLNYAAHVAESGLPRPEHQVWFNKQSTCVVGPGAPILVPTVSSMVDYEGELGVVIGRRCRHVTRDRAPDVVAGYTVVNDVSVRDWQWRAQTWTLGKSFDTHGPIGPALVTPDEVPDPHGLRLRTWVNGELRQDARTDDLIFDVWDMISHLSTVFTLEPGDVLSTGTPSGCGFALDPPRWLAAGDSVRIEIEGVGVLENPVADEASTST